MTFEAYSDESGTFDHRYQSIAIVSGHGTVLKGLMDSLQKIIDDNGIDELKFSEITGYKSPKAKVARQFMECAIKDFAGIKKARIDVITWDIQDSRHNVQRRDDITNLQIMYYNLIRHMAKRWRQTKWDFYPDINSKLDWEEIARYASMKDLGHSSYNLPTLIELNVQERFIQFGEIKPVDSIQQPLVQLADCFAGIARFSREEETRCIRWLASWGSREQLKLPNICLEVRVKDKNMRIKMCKYQLIGKLYRLCGQHKLGVSLRNRRYLRTPDPCNPINFWNYEPKGEYDKAPQLSNNID